MSRWVWLLVHRGEAVVSAMHFEIPEQTVIASPDVVGELRRHQLRHRVHLQLLADFRADLLAGNREASLKRDFMPPCLQLFAQVSSGIGCERQLFGQPKRGLVVDRRAIRKRLDLADDFAVFSHGFPFCSRVGCFKPFIGSPGTASQGVVSAVLSQQF